ncbi:MAG: acyltransferase [Bacteroides sp.]|nr:acyltransferase [Bacteroides sp.]
MIRKIWNIILHPHIFYTNRIAPKLRHLRYPMCSPSAIVSNPLSIKYDGITLCDNVTILPGARIGCVFNYSGDVFSPQLIIGDRTSIQQRAHITCAKKIEIGCDCAITHNVTITDIDHSYEYAPPGNAPINNPLIVKPVIIGNRCMIFPNAVILGGTELGENSVVAANSVVRGKFPSYCLIGGTPAKILKRYNPKTNKWDKTDKDGNFLI